MKATNPKKMPSTSDHDNNPLFYTVLEAVRKIVTSINYGIQFNEGTIEIEEPTGHYLTLPRVQWKQELQAALQFYEDEELYEDCAHCVELISRLDAEPTVGQIIRQLSDHVKEQNKD